MANREIILVSGKYKLKKLTKPQVRAIIRNEGSFEGFLCGNKVNPYHIADGWGLGVRIEMDSIERFEKGVDQFETAMVYYTPELGTYAHYYQILETIDKNKEG